MKIQVQVNSHTITSPVYHQILDLEEQEDRDKLYAVLKWQANIVTSIGPDSVCIHIDKAHNPEVTN